MPQPQFVEQFIAPLQPGDTVMHAMLYPGVYPTESDTTLHAALLRGERPRLQSPFYDLCRELVAREVQVQWLRVIPREGLFGYDRADVTAMRAQAAAIAEASGVDMRIADYGRSARALLRSARLPLPLLHSTYIGSAGTGDPKASFWRTDTPHAQLNVVNMMHYTNGVYNGAEVHVAPLPDDIVAYTDFWKGVYEGEAEPV